jgi:hypothetical protein
MKGIDGIQQFLLQISATQIGIRIEFAPSIPVTLHLLNQRKVVLTFKLLCLCLDGELYEVLAG